MNNNIMCDFCSKDAKVSITFNNGEEYISCEECIIECIKDYATTSNPVHSIQDFIETSK